MNIGIKKINNKYHVYLTIKNQTFNFIGFNKKIDAEYYLEMFEKAISFDLSDIEHYEVNNFERLNKERFKFAKKKLKQLQNQIDKIKEYLDSELNLLKGLNLEWQHKSIDFDNKQCNCKNEKVFDLDDYYCDDRDCEVDFSKGCKGCTHIKLKEESSYWKSRKQLDIEN